MDRSCKNVCELDTAFNPRLQVFVYFEKFLGIDSIRRLMLEQESCSPATENE